MGKDSARENPALLDSNAQLLTACCAGVVCHGRQRAGGLPD